VTRIVKPCCDRDEDWVTESMPQTTRIVWEGRKAEKTLLFHTSPRQLAAVIPKVVAIGLGRCGNWPGQRQDPWKYIDASSPHRKLKQILRPESHRPSPCHVISGSFPPLPPLSSRSFLKFHKHDSADSMKPIMNEQCLPGLLAIFYKNSMLAAPRPSHVALRLSHLSSSTPSSTSSTLSSSSSTLSSSSLTLSSSSSTLASRTSTYSSEPTSQSIKVRRRKERITRSAEYYDEQERRRESQRTEMNL
jgi:hypothetical protein